MIVLICGCHCVGVLDIPIAICLSPNSVCRVCFSVCTAETLGVRSYLLDRSLVSRARG
ncbi:hypothetical protein KC19_2G103200 [Ceratodon purpureus]|uniref:Uncharacterized protein n=1 Tax=Ceratodon purpureus TaxID=3225 RepID=A0A8T0ISB1_CERPU|nr:hypothetical protein KC19_2G103200 [Ceratodon purpureus]